MYIVTSTITAERKGHATDFEYKNLLIFVLIFPLLLGLTFDMFCLQRVSRIFGKGETPEFSGKAVVGLALGECVRIYMNIWVARGHNSF